MHRVSTLCVFLVLALTAAIGSGAVQDADAGRLEEARRLFGTWNEGDANRAAQICVQVDSPESVEVLLEVLRREQPRSNALAPAHFRDIAWGALLEIKDRYARKAVEAELKQNKKNPRVRQWCAEVLGEYADLDFGEALTRALTDKEDFVRAAAARALGKTRYEPAQKALEKSSSSSDAFVRANSIEALALVAPASNLKRYEKGLKDKDGGVRCALLATAPVAYPDLAERLSTEALDDEDWRPRAQATDNLGGIKTKTSVDALIRATEDGRPTVGLRAITNLQKLTGQAHTRADQWKRWWAENRETFAFPEGTGAVTRVEGATVTTFNGIQLTSDHVAFLMDKSKAMNDQLSSRGCTKDAAAHQELTGVFESLEDGLDFNIFNYALEVDAFQKQAVELTKVTARKGLTFHAEGRIDGAKDIWAVLESVLSDPTLDTAYLLSSGEPDVGLYVHWNRVTWQLRELNRFHKITVHSIAYSDNDWYAQQLERISDCTDGEFRRFQ
ncbi:MAG: HEAT repeat domain-containing protein [Planctomycetes bacterium]|nr:HEAT repeat domain-containing protein [Planctomycetota bacterium]